MGDRLHGVEGLLNQANDMTYKELERQKLNELCDRLIKAGYSTGPADSFAELAEECVLNLEELESPWIEGYPQEPYCLTLQFIGPTLRATETPRNSPDQQFVVMPPRAVHKDCIKHMRISILG